MRRLGAAIAVLLVASASLAAQPSAQPNARTAAAGAAHADARLVGRFLRDSAASDDVAAAIERAVAPMSFVTRGIGRSRLRATNQPPAEVRFELPDDSIVVRYAGQPEVRARRSGAPRPWQNAAGETFTVRVTVVQDPDGGMSVRQSFEAEDGRRENRWRVDAAGEVLQLEVTVTSPRLPQPLRYRQVFRRAR